MIDIKDAVQVWQDRKGSKRYKYFQWGRDYYAADNTAIMERKKQVFLDGYGITENLFAANHKIACGHLKTIVDQCVMYALGNGVAFETQDVKTALDTYFDGDLDNTLSDLATDARKLGESWLYAYKDAGALRFAIIPPEQTAPIYDEYGRLAVMIRAFEVGGQKRLWLVDDKERVTYGKEGDTWKELDAGGHYQTVKTFRGGQVGDPEEHGFGVVPFFSLYPNRERQPDLYRIKDKIDARDIVLSDFANNIDDFQDAFFTIKGYSGDTKLISEFMAQLKAIKAVPVGEDGEVAVHQLEVPTIARDAFIKQMDADIYKSSMAVDTAVLAGGSITNVVIKAMFADLDLKADAFETELRRFLSSVIDFINKVDGKAYPKQMAFSRTLIVNAAEVTESLIKTRDILSDETIRENMPYDINAELENKRLAEQRGEITLGGE